MKPLRSTKGIEEDVRVFEEDAMKAPRGRVVFLLSPVVPPFKM